jgi:hypothetical protein
MAKEVQESPGYQQVYLLTAVACDQKKVGRVVICVVFWKDHCQGVVLAEAV